MSAELTGKIPKLYEGFSWKEQQIISNKRLEELPEDWQKRIKGNAKLRSDSKNRKK